MGWTNSDLIYGHHLSGSNKLVPDVPSGKIHPYSTHPVPSNVQERPSYVHVVNDRGVEMRFLFETTGSIGSTEFSSSHDLTSLPVTQQWINFGETNVTAQGGTNGGKIDISPCAWSGSHADATAGDVIFVYNRGIDGKGGS